MYREKEFSLVLINDEKMGQFDFVMTSKWNSTFYFIEIVTNFDVLASENNRYYWTFYDRNFITLRNLSIKYNFDYFSYPFFDECIKIIIKDMRHYHKHAAVIIKYFFIKRIQQLRIFFLLYCIIRYENENCKEF